MKKVQKGIIAIHTLRAQKSTYKEIAERLGTNTAIVGRVCRTETKKLTAKQEKIIDRGVKEIKQSRRKSDKHLIKCMQIVADDLQGVKSFRALRMRTNQLRKEKNAIQYIVGGKADKILKAKEKEMRRQLNKEEKEAITFNMSDILKTSQIKVL
jgi:O6-methylguanine-DNA--protein-cysteine methyltransferase